MREHIDLIAYVPSSVAAVVALALPSVVLLPGELLAFCRPLYPLDEIFPFGKRNASEDVIQCKWGDACKVGL